MNSFDCKTQTALTGLTHATAATALTANGKPFGTLQDPLNSHFPVALQASQAPDYSINTSGNDFVTNVGQVTSQGDRSMRSDIARALYGVDGTGITIGILSDSFNALGKAAVDIATGDLPSHVGVLKDSPNGNDEGRAMMQLIHDVAPGARLLFHTATGGQANFAQGIVALANAGANIIVDDISYFNEPMFQDGIIAQAVDSVVSRGVSYFSSAGNSGRDSYESGFNPSGFVLNGGAVHDFNPGAGVDPFQSLSIPVGAQATIAFQWDAPFASVSPSSGGALNDIDIYLYDSTGTRLLAKSDAYNIGGDPVETIQFANTGAFGTNFNLVITDASGPAPGLMKYVIYSNSNVTINEYDTRSSTLYGHANARGGLAVGATGFFQTPAYGTNPARLESFSSPGGTPILFNLAGHRLSTREVRLKPTIVAPDGTNITGTTNVGRDISQDPDTFPNFFGTSAAAPNAAAVAALILQANPYARPADIYDALEASALDMDDPSTPGFDLGFDFGSGYGLIQADAAIRALTAGNTLGAARNLGTWQGTRTVSDFVGAGDPQDFYRIQLNTISNLSLSLSGLRADADLILIRDFNSNGTIDGGDVLAIAAASGNTPEQINATGLAPGNYFVLVNQYLGDTSYTLQLANAPVSSTQTAAIAALNQFEDDAFNVELTEFRDTSTIAKFDDLAAVPIGT